jgi:hypothetical protein
MDGPRDRSPGSRLVVIPGGRTGEGPESAPSLPREALRVIPGGPAGELQAALEETVQAARRMRAEIEARIARALEELF